MEAIYFGTSAAFGLVAWFTIFATYVWPTMQKRPSVERLKILTTVHFFRYFGLSFLITGLVVHKLPATFAIPAAFGDLTVAVLAYITFVGLQRSQKPSMAMAWILNILGTVDLLYGAIVGPTVIKDIGDFGLTYIIPTVYVPLLFAAHFYAFKTLLQRTSK